MEASILQPKSSKIGFSWPPLSPPIKTHQISLKPRMMTSGHVSKLKCAKEGGKEFMQNDGLILELAQELVGMSEKCKEIGGIVELLECLEREAIMGEDLGRHPTDYHRRALIFATSSTVFQALKHTNST